MTRIEINDGIEEVVLKMSEGNPGCAEFLMQLITKSKHNGELGGLGNIVLVDHIGLYGSQAYMLWNDCCDRDLEKVELVLENFRARTITRATIFDHVSGGRGKPFEYLVSFDALWKKSEEKNNG